jgi:PKD repeat protein
MPSIILLTYNYGKYLSSLLRILLESPGVRMNLPQRNKSAWVIGLTFMSVLFLMSFHAAAYTSASIQLSGTIKPYPTQPSCAQPPVCLFSAFPTSGSDPLPVTFTDESLYSPNSWKWEFRNATINWMIFSRSRNPQYTFPAGDYDIRLTASNSAGVTTATKYDYITISDSEKKPIASFYAYPIIGRVPLWVTFKDKSLNNPSSYSWNFGDGTVSSVKDPPPHEYQDLGMYMIQLTVVNNVGSDTDTGFIVGFH